MQYLERALVKSNAVYDPLLREGDRKWALPPLSHSWQQLKNMAAARAGPADGNKQISPLMGSLITFI